MIIIAICEDDSLFAEKLEQFVSSFFRLAKLPYQVVRYTSGEELLQNPAGFHILFLDVRLPGIGGLKTASLLRDQHPAFLLILVSDTLDDAPAGYEVQAFRYLVKPQLEEAFERYMQAAVSTFGPLRESLSLPFVGGAKILYANDITYIESQKHVALFHLAQPGKSLHIYKTLDSLEGLLPSGLFVRLHKSYLVNIRCIEQVRNYKARLCDGTVLPVSQSRFAAVKRRLVHYKENGTSSYPQN